MIGFVKIRISKLSFFHVLHIVLLQKLDFDPLICIYAQDQVHYNYSGYQGGLTDRTYCQSPERLSHWWHTVVTRGKHIINANARNVKPLASRTRMRYIQPPPVDRIGEGPMPSNTHPPSKTPPRRQQNWWRADVGRIIQARICFQVRSRWLYGLKHRDALSNKHVSLFQ